MGIGSKDASQPRVQLLAGDGLLGIVSNVRVEEVMTLLGPVLFLGRRAAQIQLCHHCLLLVGLRLCG